MADNEPTRFFHWVATATKPLHPNMREVIKIMSRQALMGELVPPFVIKEMMAQGMVFSSPHHQTLN